MFSSVLSICPLVDVSYSISLCNASLHSTMIVYICLLPPPILIIVLHIMLGRFIHFVLILGPEDALYAE